jgi:hypothetical protein
MVREFSNFVNSRLILACNVSHDRPDRARADGPVALKVHQVGIPTLTRAGQCVVAQVHHLPRKHVGPGGRTCWTRPSLILPCTTAWYSRRPSPKCSSTRATMPRRPGLYICTSARERLWTPGRTCRGTPTSGKRGFYPPPLVPKLFGPGLKGALVPVRAAGARPAPSPGR